MSWLRKKSLDAVREVPQGEALEKTLGATDILLLGIGGIIGTGIFVITGVSAAKYAGPAITLSFLLAGFVCMFVALAYTEVASMIPTSGNAYTYSYVALGEVFAWMVGWILILEYTVGASTVASGWSGYVVGILREAGFHLSDNFTKVPSEGGIINLPAALVAIVQASILVWGMKESVTLNRVLVAVKLGAIFLFLIIAAPKADLTNWENFLPFGYSGVAVGAATIFFAYIGFDMLASTAEECVNPKKDLTIGIIGSLLISTVLYMAVAAALTLIAPYQALDSAEPLALALRLNGSNIGSALVATGAIAGMTTVLLVQMYGQSRIFFVMSRDGMMPKAFSKLHKKFHTPHISTMFIGLAVAMVSGFTPIDMIAQLTSMGTLIAFIFVSIIVLVLRKKFPDLERPFKCPLVNVVAPFAIVSSFYLMWKLLEEHWQPLMIWAGLGLIIYVLYSYRASNMNTAKEGQI